MSFINISNPDKRNEVVNDYIKTKDEIRKRNEKVKESNLLRYELAQENAKPIVEATKKSSEEIKSAIERPVEDSVYDEYNRERGRIVIIVSLFSGIKVYIR